MASRPRQNQPAASLVEMREALRSAMPVWPLDGDALAWVWATTLSIASGETHEFIARLAMRPCATWAWIKTEDEGIGGVFELRHRQGIGQWQRCDHEFLITCRRGDVELPEAKQRSVILSPAGEHSAKPAAAWSVIESVSKSSLRLHNTVDAVEFNSRLPREGWAAYGTLDGPDSPVSFRAADRPWKHQEVIEIDIEPSVIAERVQRIEWVLYSDDEVVAAVEHSLPGALREAKRRAKSNKDVAKAIAKEKRSQ